MRNYTAQQVFLRSEDVKYSADIDFRLTPACAADICKMLRDYATHLRERESAKAGVTDEMRDVAIDTYKRTDNPVYPQNVEVNVNALESALEALAPMLANARVPDDAEAVCACLGDDAAAMLDANPEDERALTMWRAAHIIEAMLADAPKPEKE